MTAIGVFVATRWELSAVRQAFTSTDLQVVGGVRCHIARQATTEWWMIPMGVGPERGVRGVHCARGEAVGRALVDGVCLCLGAGRHW